IPMTTMMQQYREAKARHPGMLLFFRNGDFYELFEEDAELGARLLGLTLTKRDKSIPMAGGPPHPPARYLAQLLQAAAGATLTERPDWTFDATTARAALFRHFGVTTLAGFGFEDEQPCLA